eukprot:scaffold3498_cov176-Amphora_coffeaeformis.AAC.15
MHYFAGVMEGVRRTNKKKKIRGKMMLCRLDQAMIWFVSVLNLWSYVVKKLFYMNERPQHPLEQLLLYKKNLKEDRKDILEGRMTMTTGSKENP